MVLIIVLYMLFALTFTLAKAVLMYAKPLMFIGLRMTCAGLLMFWYLAYKKKLRYDKQSWFLLAQSTLFHVFFAYGAEFWALQYISSTKTALIYNLSPFITALLSILLLSERINVRQWMGLIIGFLGMIPLFVSFDGCEQIFGAKILTFSEFVLLCAVISSCYGWIVMRQLLDRFNYTPIHVNAMSMACGGSISLIVSWFFETRPLFFERGVEAACLSQELLPISWSALLYLGLYTSLLMIIANGICYNLYGYLLKKYSATFLSFSGFLCPIFAAVFGWTFLGESISIYMAIGFVLLVIGLALFYQGKRLGSQEQ